MRVRALLVAIVGFSTIACGNGTAQTRNPDELQVSVLRDGSILVDDRPADMAALGAALDRMRAKGSGHVAYYRESADQSPTRELEASIMNVLQAIVASELPIRMTSKPDFSDWIDDKGQSRPYTPETEGAK